MEEKKILKLQVERLTIELNREKQRRKEIVEEKKDRKETEEKIPSKQVVDREEPEEKIPPKRVVEKRKREEEEMTLEEKVDKLVKIEEKRQKSWNVADYNRKRKQDMKRRIREETEKEKRMWRARMEVEEEFRKNRNYH